MADPLSISVSALTVIAAAISSTTTVCDIVRRYKGRDQMLGRLLGGLEDLVNILQSLEQSVKTETPILKLLEGPVDRCAQLCREFGQTMEKFGGKSKTGFRDWRKMEFMRGNINDFIDTVAEYKATISIGLGTITLQTMKTTQQVVDEYNDMVKTTTYNLEMRLLRIQQDISVFVTQGISLSEESSIDLQDEKLVTEQCLRICERAKSFLESLRDKQPVLQETGPQLAAGYAQDQFEAQLLTRKTIDESRDSFLETIGRIRERLEAVVLSRGPDRDGEITRLQEELSISKQCLEVCNTAATEVSSQKIFIVGDVTAAEDCGQVVATSLADLFQVGNLQAAKGSKQLITSTDSETLRQMSRDHFNSRSKSMNSPPTTVPKENTTVQPRVAGTRRVDDSAANSNQERSTAGSETATSRPSPNEMRRRKTGDDDTKKTRN